MRVLESQVELVKAEAERWKKEAFDAVAANEKEKRQSEIFTEEKVLLKILVNYLLLCGSGVDPATALESAVGESTTERICCESIHCTR